MKIEGSVVVTCDDCARYGEVVGFVSSRDKKKPALKPEEKEDVSFDAGGDELIDNYPEVIRKKREMHELKQEDLAKLINEPASLIHRVETGRMEPSLEVARKLQKALGVRLLHKSDSGSIDSVKPTESDELTLGDMVVIKKRGEKK